MNRNSFAVSWVLLGLFWFVLHTPAAAQAGTGVIAGTVRAAGGGPVSGARVMVAGTGLGTVAEPDGAFRIRGVPEGRHTLVASRVGYGTTQQAVTVRGGTEQALSLMLSPEAAVLEGLDVVGQRRRVASATRTDTELLDIPQNIQVIGEDVFRQQAVTDLQDAVRNVSNVTFVGTYNGGYQYFSSRGFWMSNVSNYRRNGLLLPNFGQNYADYVDRIEVLKGPAGILYGDVTPGGIINVVTKKPLSYPYRRAELRVGEYGLFRPALDLSGPLTPGKTLLGRLNASYERSGSFRDMVESDGFMVAPTLTWTPTDRTVWNVEGTYREDERVGDPGLISPDGTVEGLRRIPISRFLGEPNATYSYDDRSAVSTLQHELGGGWRLRNVAGYGFQTRTPLNIYLRDADSLGNVLRRQYFSHQERETWSAALDLLGEVATGPIRHQLVFGADWMTHTQHTAFQATGNIPGSIDLYDPQYGQAELRPFAGEMEPFKLLTRRGTLYAQDQISFDDDRVHLLLGVRFNDFTQGNRYQDGTDPPADEPGDVRERPVSPRFGVVYKPAPWLSTYVSYSEAYEINGFDSIDPAVSIPPTFGIQWEAGLKGDLFGERLGFTLAAFRIRKEDVYGWADLTEPVAPAFAVAADVEGGWYTYLAPLHRSQGVELDFNGRVSERLTLIGAAAYTEAEIVEDPAYPAGNWLSNTPRATWNVWANYRPSGALNGVELGGGVFHKGRFYGTDDNAPGGLVSPSTTADVAVGYTFRNLHAQLNVRNLTDETSYLGGFGDWEPLWPRRAVLSLAVTF